MKSNTLKSVSAILAIVMGIIACRGQAVSQPTPSPSSEPLHEIYAGFTENEKIPFLMIHQSGESLGVIRDVNSPNNIGGIVWYSSEGQSVTVYTDNSQMPQRAVVGEDIILYSNYLNDTVDVTIIHPDGTSETFRAQIDTELLNKITAFSPSVRLVSYSLSEAQQLDKWFFIKTGLYIAGAALCIKDIPSAVGVPVVGIPLLLTGACSGFLLGSVIRAGSLLNIDVTDLADAKSVWDTQKCFAPASPDLVSRALACANALASELERQEQTANQKVTKLPSDVTSATLCGWIDFAPPGTGVLELTLTISDGRIFSLLLLEEPFLRQIMDLNPPGYFRIVEPQFARFYDGSVSTTDITKWTSVEKVNACSQ